MLVIQTLLPYGGQRVLLDLANALGDVGLVVVVLEDASEELRLPSAVKVVRLHRKEKGALSFYRCFRSLRQEIGVCRPVAVLSFMTYANILTLAVRLLGRRGPRVVISEHNVLTEALSTEGSRGRMGCLVRHLYRFADAIVVVSESIGRDLRLNFNVPGGKIVKIYNAIDISRVKYLSGAGSSIVDRVPGEVRIVCVAALKRAKGHDILLRALSALSIEYRLMIVGDGSLRAELEALAYELGVRERVEFLGFLANPFPEIRVADIFVLPSRWEGFGIVAAEAAALGVPVIASNTGGLAELVPSIVPGLLVEAESAAALTCAIEALDRGKLDVDRLDLLSVQRFRNSYRRVLKLRDSSSAAGGISRF